MCTWETIRNESLKGVIQSWASRLREANCRKVTWKRMADGGEGYHAESSQQAYQASGEGSTLTLMKK